MDAPLADEIPVAVAALHRAVGREVAARLLQVLGDDLQGVAAHMGVDLRPRERKLGPRGRRH